MNRWFSIRRCVAFAICPELAEMTRREIDGAVVTMSVGARLREERRRLGYTQEAFAGLGNVGRKSQHRYEAGTRSPDANYLEAIAAAGADIAYIVIGVSCDRFYLPSERGDAA